MTYPGDDALHVVSQSQAQQGVGQQSRRPRAGDLAATQGVCVDFGNAQCGKLLRCIQPLAEPAQPLEQLRIVPFERVVVGQLPALVA
ncbi:hypothetical protein D3C75_918640 [compost metagenome]